MEQIDRRNLTTLLHQQFPDASSADLSRIIDEGERFASISSRHVLTASDSERSRCYAAAAAVRDAVSAVAGTLPFPISATVIATAWAGYTTARKMCDHRIPPGPDKVETTPTTTDASDSVT